MRPTPRRWPGWRALDGIPPAVELAAMRLRSLAPEQILARLGSRFQLLSGGGPAAARRHRTLQAALDWSYELLTEAEQATWRRVSVFAGSFDLDAAEAVCAVGRVDAGQVAALDADHENLREALRFCLSEPGGATAGAQIACDLWRYWETHGHLTEGRRVLVVLLERPGQTFPAPRTLWVAGYLAMVQGDMPTARTLLEAGLSAARLLGDSNAEAWALSFLGYVIYSLGQAEDGQARVESALRLHEELGNQIGVALAFAQTGFIRLCSGEPRIAAHLYSRCARVSASSGNVWYETYAQWAVGVATWMLGDPGSAAASVRAALAVMHQVDEGASGR